MSRLNICIIVLSTIFLLFISVCNASKDGKNSSPEIMETFSNLDASIRPSMSNEMLSTQSVAVAIPTTNSPLASCSIGEKFNDFNDSILNYFLRRETCDIIEDTDSRMTRICNNKQFAYNEYYNVSYLLACHQRQFNEICGDHNLVIPWRRDYTVDSSLLINNFRAQNDMQLVTKSCSSVIEFLRAFQHDMTLGDNATDLASNYTLLMKMRVLTSGKMIEVEYSEWYISTVPFCRNFACGAGKHDHHGNQTSVYDCMPQECRGTIMFAITFDAILAVLIIVANSLVLGVAARTRIMRNIPGYFKISLALADITVGLFVLPCCIYTTAVVYLGAMPYRGPGHKKSIADYMPTSLANFISFVVVLSFAVSIYTMAVASIDRYLAITKPFAYRYDYRVFELDYHI